MYFVLLKIPINSKFKRISKMEELKNTIDQLKILEEKFWSLFVKKFGTQPDKTSFQYNNNEQTIGFWRVIGDINVDLIDIFFGTKVCWVRKPDPMEVTQTVHNKYIELLVESI